MYIMYVAIHFSKYCSLETLYCYKKFGCNKTYKKLLIKKFTIKQGVCNEVFIYTLQKAEYVLQKAE